MSDRIREDLEAHVRDTLGRPRLRVTSVDPIPEGHSGFTYFVTIEDGDGSTRYVLRLPPPGARIAGPADVVRQGRIMAALHAAYHEVADEMHAPYRAGRIIWDANPEAYRLAFVEACRRVVCTRASAGRKEVS